MRRVMVHERHGVTVNGHYDSCFTASIQKRPIFTFLVRVNNSLPSSIAAVQNGPDLIFARSQLQNNHDLTHALYPLRLQASPKAWTSPSSD